jgi:predicted Zn-dependent peptidase
VPNHLLHLPNGLTLVAEPWADARSVAIGVFVCSGARDETLSGTAHFLEHLCFKGDAGRDAAAMNAAFDAIGARVDAFTTQELTAYHSVTLPQYQSDLTALLFALLRPALRPADVDVERQVILEEIAMYRDDPSSVLFEGASRAYYSAHPFARSVLGTKASLAAITPDDLRAHAAQWYAPDRLNVVACGCVDWEALVAQVRAITADWQPSGSRRMHPAMEPRAGATHLHGDVVRAQAALYAPGFACNDPRHSAADLLAQIVGDGNSRLYWALVDDGLCDDAGLEHSAEDGLGAFYGTLSTAPEHLSEAIARYQDVLGGVARRGIKPAELERVKKRLEVALSLRFETPGSRLLSLGEGYAALGRYRSVPQLLSELRAVTMHDVNAVLETNPFATLNITTLEPTPILVPA